MAYLSTVRGIPFHSPWPVESICAIMMTSTSICTVASFRRSISAPPEALFLVETFPQPHDHAGSDYKATGLPFLGV